VGGERLIKIAIVEDERATADVLGGFLKRYEAERNEKIIQTRFSCTTDFLSAYSGFDIVFMDINFKNDIDGIQAAKKMREYDSSVTLIFVTSFEQFAVKGYEVEAFDFIVKPVVYVDFSLRLSRAIKHVQKEKLDVIHLKTGSGVKIIPVKDIKYVEVLSHNLLFHMVDGVFGCGGSLREMEAMLEKQYFVRCNNCYLVNLRYVTAVDGYTISVDGEQLTVSRPRKKEFLSALNRYLGK